MELWDDVVVCWDSYTDEHVRLKVMLFAILMDYKGAVDAAQVMDVGSYAGCLICKFWGTFATCLHKMVYMFCKQDPEGTTIREG